MKVKMAVKLLNENPVKPNKHKLLKAVNQN
jgi:hypothetical protein